MTSSRTVIAAVFLTLVTVAVLLLSSCGGPSLSPEVRDEIERDVEEIMEERDIPGGVVGVWVPGRGELVLALGRSDIDTGEEMHLDDRFRIGSITKTFTATLILQLKDEGLLGLDDPLDAYVSGVPGGGEITVRQLCDNTSGLYNYGEDERLAAALEEDPHRVWSPRELVDIAVSHPPLFAPGEGWAYSNTNFVLLGMIVEEVTGNGFAEELRERIIEPLGLTATYLATEPEMKGDYSHGYEYASEESRELVDRTDYLDPSIVWSAGAMVSNLEDLETWAGALAGGELLSEASHREQLSWVDIPEDGEIDTGYGLGVLYIDGLIGHDGRQPGYDAAVFYYPERETTLVALLNKAEETSIAMGVLMRIASILFPDDFGW
ncbi:MAG: serine hydrolase domain-containing protein [Actinomycetota bacterium]|nr:serine hydrolase domain-containing protein [Actinomycetota bacterium]